jgi:hypothetical protein
MTTNQKLFLAGTIIGLFFIVTLETVKFYENIFLLKLIINILAFVFSIGCIFIVIYIILDIISIYLKSKK